MKSYVGSQRVMEKSNIHKGSPSVTREVNGHLICYVCTLIVQVKDFSPWLLLLGIREEDHYFGVASDCYNAPLLGLLVFNVLMYLGNFT